ncbi:MAG TPA: type II toxin-antitoxin system MqsR family toxin [Polyangiaceae bacterium]|nr:type II toxin-antitoxin system MqsR family toxin [Polyangiaceae bacterium]
MEKRIAHYDLATIKVEFASVATLRLTHSALVGARAVGIDRAGIVAVIQSIRSSHFYKSMTSHNDQNIWQDVYHVPAAKTVLYVKFTVNHEGKLLISFKRK